MNFLYAFLGALFLYLLFRFVNDGWATDIKWFWQHLSKGFKDAIYLVLLAVAAIVIISLR